MSNLEAFLGKLDPKVAKTFKTAQEITKEFLPSSSITVNYVLGGGFARGAITTVYGNESAGKSGMLMETVGHLQKLGFVCAWVDVENSFDTKWATRLGVNTEELFVIQERSSGAIGDKLAPLLKAGIDFVVIDSISVIMPEVFLEDGEMKDYDKRKQIGANAKATGILLNGILYDNDRTAVVLISQTRAKDSGGGHMAMKPTGGQAVVFGSSAILKLTSSNTESNQKMGKVFLGDKVHQLPIGREVKVFGEKNKVGVPQRSGNYIFYYAGDNVGIDHVDELVTMGKMYGSVRAAGAWVYFEEEKWNGQNAFVEELKNNPDLYKRVKDDTEMKMTGEVKDDEQLGKVQADDTDTGW